MRKTSHDGADSSSITSGKDSDTKKCAASFNKMTKSSIKRKVQNFSHDSDDGIIEPLLQTDREKTEIANRSAKYLLNKSKTESLHEKDNKVTEGFADKCSVPINVSSTSNIIKNDVKESPVSTSYTCGSAPVHNHMNTNIFSSYEASTGLITTKNQIIVGIDNSKPGKYSPSPLIFTTAKIHTDSNSKVMEPVQLTPVPILSTIEDNIIKAGVVPGPETKTSSLTKTPSDGIKVLSGKLGVNVLQTYKDKTCSPPVAHSFLESETLNENAMKLAITTSSLESSANLIYQDIKLVQLSSSEILPATAKYTSSKNTSFKEQPFINILVPTSQTNISITDKVKKPTEISTSASSSNNVSGKCSSLEKSEESFHTSYTKDSKIALDLLNLQNQDNAHNKNLETPEHQKTLFNSKDGELVLSTSVSSNKKLQRQKNALNEATNDSDNKTLKTDMQNLHTQIDNNSSTKTVKVPKQENKSDFTPRDTLPIATKVLTLPLTSAHPPKSITASSSTEMKNIVLVSTPKVKSILETVNTKPTLSVCKDVTKSQNKSTVTTNETDVKDSKALTAVSSKPPSSALSSSKLTAVSVSAKPEILSSSPCSSHSVKNNPSIDSIVTTAYTPLPSYIVSTSKTKIGLTMTTNTPVVTLKAQIQKPIVNVHTTSAFATSGAKTSPSPSATNGTKHTVFIKQAKSNAETIKKDGRA